MTSTEKKSGSPTNFPDLLRKYNKIEADLSIAGLLEKDKHRFTRFSRRFQGLLLDYSKTTLTSAALGELLELAESSNLQQARADLFAGEVVNVTEGRAALHPWLRSAGVFAGKQSAAEIDVQRRLLFDWAETLRSGRIPGGNKNIQTIVHVGIGGSVLGPQLIADACSTLRRGEPELYFLASADGHGLERLLEGLDPRKTVFIIASKSFSTRETLQNATTVKTWLGSTVNPSDHLLAITANNQRASDFGIQPDKILTFPEGIGGRYSLWSTIGLPAAAAIGNDNFSELLAGAASMDDHFQTAPLADNLPVLLALTGIWHRNVCGHESLALMPYDTRLRLLPDWVQQLDMESCGKGVDQRGKPLGWATAPVILGGVGTEAQHAVFQALHQGTSVIPVEFVGVLHPDHGYEAHHRIQLAHLLAQSEALALGRNSTQTRSFLEAAGLAAESVEQLTPHRTFPGNRPSVCMLLDRLTPHSLGQLLALYEHKIFVQSVIWGINPFDQWGVEYGKTLADGYERQLGAAAHGETPAEPGKPGLAGYVCSELAAFGRQKTGK